MSWCNKSMARTLIECVETSTGKYVKVPECVLKENPRRFWRLSDRMLDVAQQIGLEPELRVPKVSDEAQHLIQLAYRNLISAQARNSHTEIPIRKAELEQALDMYSLGGGARKSSSKAKSELPALRKVEPRIGSAIVEMWFD